ncbi:NAD-dependent DNA ligase LigA [Opitutus terrae]|uniref:DNA ligase 2 n=1 Tax=Opitutus terrae (strain DSM 11246 / JCM 15787 / PB90-1) TaxID=452637 RepID=DNLJ2_OPITP|nr:NAD-dependent DNA ligase LigA [Opitutus terrae]B1ZMR3.1 RecName: Full=DNA ligase 2; AltName: Full=Polydeoxyribonucleotide synthase [NAD(+)] 2 [Opitutus terrae PB90-1]ACB75341.1 DNA ligase, NAD-dependent [Opitutus terrae PB90-1]
MRPWFSSVARRLALGASLGVVALTVIPNLSCAARSVSVAETESLRRLELLRVEIARHDDLYFRKAQPEISDADYDALKQELRELESRFGRRVPRDPAALRDMGDDRVSGFPKARHRMRMLSLEKTTTESGVRAFDQALRRLVKPPAEIAYVVEPKFDGLAISATYEEGRLVRLVTRGNGEEGDDVTAAAGRIRTLPPRLAGAAWPRVVEVRGEVFLTFAEFERINRGRRENGRPTFSSPRNLAVGTLKSLEPEDREVRQLDVVFFGLGAIDGHAAPASQTQLLEWIAQWGLPSVEDARRVDSIDDAWRAVQELGGRRSHLAFPIDGAVIKLDDAVGQTAAGVSEVAPRWAIAFKYAPARVGTRVRGVALQVGRTGVITPVAELEPVALAGARITRATLHNASEMERSDLRVGDFVWIERMGEIIPAVVAVDTAQRGTVSAPFVFPRDCPGCGALLVRALDDANWRCTNDDCPARQVRKVEHYVSDEGVGIRGLGAASVEALVRSQRVREIPDLYTLTAAEVTAHTRLSAAQAARVVDAIQRSRKAPLRRVIAGLGLPGIGPAGANALGARFADLPQFAAARESDLQQVEGLRPESVRALATALSAERTQQLLARLAAAGVGAQSATADAGTLAGKEVVFTGTLPTLSRRRATELVEEAGGRVADRVTAATWRLVAGRNPASKLHQATALGVPVIEEAELLRLAEAAPE